MTDLLAQSVFCNAEVFNFRTYRLLIDRNLAPSLAQAITNDPVTCRRLLGDLMPGIVPSRHSGARRRA